jgi:N-acetylmuramoyl-L-alanine amidase
VALRVLVQKGHVYPREPGFEGGTGTAREQEFVTLVADALAKLLRDDGRFEPVVVPGDIPNGVKVDAALFLHGDGSASASSSGYCFGYPEYGVNKSLADRIAVEFDKIPGHPPHRRDNYTAALRGYYGYSRVNTLGPEVLVEHGFLTNPGERLWLFANVDKLARAEYRAVCGYFGFNPRDDAANVKRRAVLRAWILKRRGEGWSWARIKAGPNWREFIRRGGK